MGFLKQYILANNDMQIKWNNIQMLKHSTFRIYLKKQTNNNK